jgi:succinate dehydrogenase / fumarate reductase iron-sulfur subunit
MGLGMCNITKCCTEVCPEHIKITDNAIIPLKERVVDASYDPIAWLGRTILRRTKRSALDAALEAPGQRAPTRQEETSSPPPVAGPEAAADGS